MTRRQIGNDAALFLLFIASCVPAFLAIMGGLDHLFTYNRTEILAGAVIIALMPIINASAAIYGASAQWGAPGWAALLIGAAPYVTGAIWYFFTMTADAFNRHPHDDGPQDEPVYILK